jgi:hypothetical protein
MPHGDYSDIIGLSTLALGATSIFYPKWMTLGFGALKPALSSAVSDSTLTAIQAGGAPLMALGMAFSVVRWNKVNSIAAVAGCVVTAINYAYIGLKMDNFTFVLRPWYIISAVFLAGAYHFAFHSNPMLTSADLLKKEKEEAEKKKGK